MWFKLGSVCLCRVLEYHLFVEVSSAQTNPGRYFPFLSFPPQNNPGIVILVFYCHKCSGLKHTFMMPQFLLCLLLYFPLLEFLFGS